MSDKEKGKLTEGDMTAAEKEAAEIQNQEAGEKDDLELAPLFDEGDTLSEEHLAGVDPEKEAADKKAEAEAKEAENKKKADEEAAKKAEADKGKPPGEKEKPADPKPKGDEKDVKPPEKDETKEAKPDEADPDYTKPPPKGYVPLPAVQQEREENTRVRTENRGLQAQVTQLQGEVETLKTKQPVAGTEDEFKDFKVLSNKEFEDLNNDDPDAAAAYTYKYVRFNQFQNVNARKQQADSDLKRNESAIVQGAYDRMKTAIPDIENDNSEIVDKLIDFAVGQGFDENYLGILTHPETRIIPVGNKNSYVLGPGAASLIDMITKFHQLSQSDPEKLRSDITAEVEKDLRGTIEKEVREKVTQELLSKLKENPDEFRSIDTVPGAETTVGDKTFISEVDYAKYSEAERERLLSGSG